MSISIHPPQRPQQWSPEERYRFLSAILESFAGTLDLQEVLRRIVNITMQQFAADRALLIPPVSETTVTANVRYAATSPHVAVTVEPSTPIALTLPLMRRALQ